MFDITLCTQRHPWRFKRHSRQKSLYLVKLNFSGPDPLPYPSPFPSTPLSVSFLPCSSLRPYLSPSLPLSLFLSLSLSLTTHHTLLSYRHVISKFSLFLSLCSHLSFRPGGEGQKQSWVAGTSWVTILGPVCLPCRSSSRHLTLPSVLVPIVVSDDSVVTSPSSLLQGPIRPRQYPTPSSLPRVQYPSPFLRPTTQDSGLNTVIPTP